MTLLITAVLSWFHVKTGNVITLIPNLTRGESVL